MDIVHHGVLAAAGMGALASSGHIEAGVAFAAGSVLPDLDVLLMAGGKRFYLRHHQRLTHSVIFIPIASLAIAYVLFLLQSPFWPTALAAGAGFVVHVLLDLTNTYGTGVLWPFSPRRLSLDALFFIDATAWGLTLSFAGASYVYNSAVLFFMLFPTLVAYVAVRVLIRRRVLRSLPGAMVVPGAFNPFIYFVVRDKDASVEVFQYNALTHTESSHLSYPRPDSRVLDLAGKSAVFRDMQHVAKFLFVTEVLESAEGTKIVARDLAVRNFGGNFARTELEFDSEGRILSERANI